MARAGPGAGRMTRNQSCFLTHSFEAPQRCYPGAAQDMSDGASTHRHETNPWLESCTGN